MNLAIFKKLAPFLALLTLAACGDSFENVNVGDFRCVQQNSPCEVNFGRLDLNRPGQTAKVEVTNVGEGDLELRGIRLVDTSPLIRFSDTTVFYVLDQTSNGWRVADDGRSFRTDDGTFIIPPNGRVEIELQFDPDGNDPLCPNGLGGGGLVQCGSVEIESNDIDSDERVVSAPILVEVGDSRMEVSPTVISFSPAQLLDPGAGIYATQERTFTISNLGTGNMELRDVNPESVELTATDDSGANFPITLFGGAERVIRIEWTPTSDEPLSSQITVTSNASTGGTRVIIVNSEGGADAAIEVDPCDFFFGETAVGDTAESLFDVTNVGNAPMTWSVSITGVRPTSARSDFDILSGTDQPAMGEQSTLDGGATSTLKLVYTPSEAESVTGGVSFRGNFGTSFECPFAAGEAVAGADVAPANLYWGGIEDGESEARSFVISNSGRADLEVSSIDVGGDSHEEWTVDALAAGGFTLAPGNSRRVEVTYTRDLDDLPAQDDATISLNHNGAGAGVSQVFLTATHGDEFLPPTCDLSVDPPEPYDVGETAILDASGSSLNAGDWATNQFQWTLVRPDGSSAELSDLFGSSTQLTFDAAGTYSVGITATAVVGGESLSCEATRNLVVQ